MKRSRIPKQLKIGGFSYKVVHPYVFENDYGKLATHEWNQKKIKISDVYLINKRAWIRKTESFLHEIIHAIDYCFLNNIMTEDEVDAFSRHIFMVIRDNDLQLSKNVLPSTIRIAGCDFTVNCPYEFSDGETFTGNLSDETLELRLLDRNGKSDVFSPQTIMTNFLYLVMCVITDLTLIPKGFELYVGTEVGANILASFTNGLYQVIVDNDLEKLFKSDGETK